MSELESNEPEEEEGLTPGPLNGGFATAEAELDHLFMVVVERARVIAGRSLLPENAEDIAQQVGASFWRAWKARPARFLDSKALNAWVARTTHYRIIDRIRVASLRMTENRDEVDPDQLVASVWTIPDKRLEYHELEAVLAAAFALMSERRRAIFLAVREEGSTYETVAAAHHTTYDAVKYQVTEALKLLRRVVEQYFGYFPLQEPKPPKPILPSQRRAPEHTQVPAEANDTQH